MSSYLTPTFTPFRSSGGICYPSKDYAGYSAPATGGKKSRKTKSKSKKVKKTKRRSSSRSKSRK